MIKAWQELYQHSSFSSITSSTVNTLSGQKSPPFYESSPSLSPDEHVERLHTVIVSTAQQQ